MNKDKLLKQKLVMFEAVSHELLKYSESIRNTGDCKNIKYIFQCNFTLDRTQGFIEVLRTLRAEILDLDLEIKGEK